MRYLLDTHALLWALGDPGRLRAATRAALDAAGSDVFVSAVSLWEIVVKRRIGKLEADVAAITAQLAPATKLRLLPVQPAHLLALDRLPVHPQHRDPFDHLLVAQALAEGLTFVTQDTHAPLYGVAVLAA